MDDLRDLQEAAVHGFSMLSQTRWCRWPPRARTMHDASTRLALTHLLELGNSSSLLQLVKAARHLVRDEILEEDLHEMTSSAVLVIVCAPLLEYLEHPTPIELLDLINYMK